MLLLPLTLITEHIFTASSFTVTDSAATRRAYVMGTMTLSSIKNFTVAGDATGVGVGYFGTVQKYTGQTTAGGTAKLSTVASISVASQEHASDAIAVLDAAIAKIDQQRADLGAISNRLSSVVDKLLWLPTLNHPKSYFRY